MKHNKLKKCRICGNENLFPVMSLGEQYISALFPDSLDYKKTEKKYPLNLVMCVKDNDTCGTVQLDHEFDLTDMYKVYPYSSSTNRAMISILKDVAESGLKLVDIKEDDLILDIAGNDCLLVSNFEKYNCNTMVIDAATMKPVFDHPKLKNIQGTYFTKESFNQHSDGKKAKLIYCIAAFYHINNPIQFLQDVEACLDDNGVFIVQMAYLLPMLKQNMLDNIIAEHATYYSFNNLEWMTRKTGLEIFHGEENDVYNGSMRVFFRKRGNPKYPITKGYLKILDDELSYGIFNLSVYYEFGYRIDKARIELINLLNKFKKEGKTVYIYGASSKGNSIMQYYCIGRELIEAAADVAPWKLGCYMIGSDIPIISQDEMRLRNPDYLLSLAYSFTDKFMEQEAELIKRGTKFIVPLPEVKILP